VTDIDKTMKDLALCLKPGIGLLLCIGGDLELWDENMEKVKIAREADEANLSGLSDNGSWLQRIIWGECDTYIQRIVSDAAIVLQRHVTLAFWLALASTDRPSF
jgi:hypothetical protein